MSTSSESHAASLEALLFIHGEPLTHKKIESVLGLKKGEVEAIVAEVKKRLEESGRGLQLVSDGEKVQLATKPEFNRILEDFIKEELTEDLTPASLEALSIVAYLGPITRAKIEYLRGVNSIVILRSLMIRGLVERFPDPERPSGFLYQPTFDLIKHLGLKNKELLPEYEKFRGLLKVFEGQNAAPPPSFQPPIPKEAHPHPGGEQA